MALRKAGGVCGNHQLVLERKLDFNEKITDVCFEIIYPVDERTLTIDHTGKVIWHT